MRIRRFSQCHQLETLRPLGRKFSKAPRPWRRRRSLSYAAGVGKTLSAKRYANWERANPTPLMSYRATKAAERKIDAALAESRTVFYTPSVGVTPAALRREHHRQHVH